VATNYKYEAVAQRIGQDWHYDPKTRGIKNTATGEKLSRRQFDKRYGLLKEQGYQSFEQKGKARKEVGLDQYWKKVSGAKRLYYKRFKSIEQAREYAKTLPNDYKVYIQVYGELFDPKYGNNIGAKNGYVTTQQMNNDVFVNEGAAWKFGSRPIKEVKIIKHVDLIRSIEGIDREKAKATRKTK
jgi:Lhr-like helicase